METHDKKEQEVPEVDMQELDKKLHEFALADFELFCRLTGVNKTQAYVCFELRRGLSYGQLGIKLRLGKSTVYAIAQKCPEEFRPQKLDGM